MDAHIAAEGRMPKKKRTREAGTGPSHGWAIVVRLANGSRAYYYIDERHRDAAGNPLECWGRKSQALGFASEGEARSLATQMLTNSSAKEYEVVRLP